MSTPWPQSVTLTSTSQFSAPISLDPLAKMTAVELTVASPSSAASTATTFYVQATLDTPAYNSANSTPLPSPQPLWSQIGSSVYSIVVSSLSVVTNTNLSTFDNSAAFGLLQPVAGLRLGSTAAGGVPAGTTVTLRALQSPTA